MIKKLVGGLLVLSSFGFGLLRAADAFIGTWKLNVAKSNFAKGREFKDLTLTAVEQGDNAMVTVRGFSGDGKTVSYKFTISLKGGSINYIQGTPNAWSTASAKRLNANTLDGTGAQNGKQVGTAHVVVSADGKTLTQTRSGTDENGKAFKNILVFDRQ